MPPIESANTHLRSVCMPFTLLLSLPALLLFAGCRGSESEEAGQTKSAAKTPVAIPLDHTPTQVPRPPRRPPDPLARVIETIKARGGKVSRDEAGVTAIDWQRAAIHNLDLELLTEIPTLRRLYLSGTRIDERGLMYLSTLPNLERLALWRTPIKDDDLKYLAGATKLKVLDLSHNRLAGTGLQYLENCQELETLILNHTRCGNYTLPWIAKLRSLRVLDLQATLISSGFLDRLKALPHLEEIRMHFRADALPHLAEFPNLRRLTLPRQALTPPANYRSAIPRMKTLERIQVVNGGVNDDVLLHLAKCPNLGEIHVQGSTELTDAGLAHLHECRTLRLLDVRDTETTAAAVRKLAQANRHLRILVNPIELHRLSGAFGSLGIGARHSRDGGPRLRLDREMHITALRLDDARIFPPGLKVIARAIEPDKLEHLSLANTKLTDEDLANFPVGINLQHLNLNGTQITPEGLKTWGGGQRPELPYLETLDLGGLTLDDDCLKWIGTLDRLKVLRLADVQNVTQEGWAALKGLPHLEELTR